MSITYPLLHPPTPGFRSIRISPNDAVSVASSPFTGQQQVQAHQGQWWNLDATLPPMNQAGSADDWAAWLTALRGRYGTFLLGDSSRKTPRGSVALSAIAPYVYGASQTGNTLVTRGWAASSANVLKAGDYIQLGGINLLGKSQGIDDTSYWVPTLITVSANSVTAPDGSNTADTLTPASGADCYVIQVINPRNYGELYTFSVWLRVPSGTASIPISIYQGDIRSWIEKSCSVGTAWQRFSVTCKNIGPGGAHALIGRGPMLGTVFYAWGAQVNPGSDPDAYIPTTSAAVNGTARLHKVLNDVSTDSNGQATLEIWPRLRESPANGAYIKTSNCKGTFRLSSNERPWDVDESKLYGVSFSAVEAI